MCDALKFITEPVVEKSVIVLEIEKHGVRNVLGQIADHFDVLGDEADSGILSDVFYDTAMVVNDAIDAIDEIQDEGADKYIDSLKDANAGN